MSKNIFCTIVTGDYIPYAMVLHRSLTRFNKGQLLRVLICDDTDTESWKTAAPGIEFINIKEILHVRKADLLYEMYAGKNTNALRWAFKPVLLNFLVNDGFDKVIYVDCDIYFTNDYHFLFEELTNSGILLSPAWTTKNHLIREQEFLTAFKYGLFNAGFVGATKKGTPALEWWADCCSYKVETNFESGLFVDQKYLDGMPVLFENINWIRHRGCNIAIWNQLECKRGLKKGEVVINDEYPVIFIHFTNHYIPDLLAGTDPLIFPYYLEYEAAFASIGADLKRFVPGTPQYVPPSTLKKIKHKLLIRTRVKNWLFKLSERL